jgi:hypothetical protein
MVSIRYSLMESKWTFLKRNVVVGVKRIETRNRALCAVQCTDDGVHTGCGIRFTEDEAVIFRSCNVSK